MADTYETRSVSSATDDGITASHRIGVSLRDDVSNGVGQVRSEQYVQVGHPLQFLQACDIAGVVTAGFYPQDSSSVTSVGAACTASSNNTISLAAGAPNWDITGYLICMLNSTELGQVRRIIAYNTTTLIATVDRNWDDNPESGDTYTIGIDCSFRSWLVVKAECEGTFAQSPTISVIPYLMDYPRNPPTSGTHQGKLGVDGVKRAPKFTPGAILDMDNYDFQGNTEISSYYHMRSRSDQVLGACMAKIRYHSVAGTSKKVGLWLATI
jgi:hypothetical protein